MVVTASTATTPPATTEPAPLRPRRGLRRCPPVESPLPVRALLRAIVRSVSGADVRAELCAYLEQRFDARRAILFSSGTHALTAAIDAALEGAGERIVALPGFGCYDLATAAIGAGARVVLYDLDPETLGPAWDSFDAALDAGAKAAVIAPLFGYPIDWDRAERAAQRTGAMLIEDAAQGAGGQWKCRPLGSLGPLSVLSFGRGKGWTGAGGGALLVRADVRVQRPAASSARHSVRALISACAQLVLSRPRLYALPASLPWLHLGETRYNAPSPIRDISRFSAALAFATRDAARSARDPRAARSTHYAKQLTHTKHVQTIRSETSDRPGYLRYPVRITDERFRDLVVSRLQEEGVAPSYPEPLGHLPALGNALLNGTDRLPGAGSLSRELLTVPTHPASDSNLAERILSLRQETGAESTRRPAESRGERQAGQRAGTR